MTKRHILLLSLLTLLFVVGCQSDDNSTPEPNDDKGHSIDEELKTKDDDELDEESLTLPDAELQKHDESNGVQDLQTSLKNIGYDIDLSGLYDERTVWAITDIQLQDDDLYVTGIYDGQTKDTIQSIINGEKDIRVGGQLAEPKQADTFTETVENPYDVLALVNKKYALPSDYEPFDLTVPDVRFPFTEDDPKKQLRQVAADALEDMFQASDADGVELYALSGYRSYERQDAIFASNAEKHGEDHANTYSARPGESEHQTGLVMDVTSRAIGFSLEIEFENTAEGQWVQENAHHYGFIIRYPDGKESITQYQYEPWHLRYVGVNAATAIKNDDTTLEQYLGD